MKVMIVEDDRTVHYGLKQHISKKYGTVISAYTVAEALRLLDASIDLYLLDVALPDGTGIQVLEGIRKTMQTPVLFLSAHDDEKTMNRGFEEGADDYITKPFRLSDLDNRIQSILRRSNIKRIHGLTVDTTQGVVSINDEPIILSVIEYQILLLLIHAYPNTLSKERLIETIWGEASDNTLSVTMRRLRKKVETGIKIDNVVGKGYKIQ